VNAIQAAVLGSDVSKSRSPAIHQAAFKALGIEGRYVALSVSARRFTKLVAELRADGFRYVNVTIPHKHAAAALATSRARAVQAAGAANTLIFGRGTAIRAENTDGAGLLAALRDLGADVAAGTRAVIVGSGGAAAGAVEALTSAGAQIRIVARRPRAAQSIRARLPARRREQVTIVAWRASDMAVALESADLLISAVPAAAWTDAEARAGLGALDRHAAVLEMAYGAGTPLSGAVRRRVARYADGLGMLVHQAAVAIALAVGQSPPLPPLFRAARAAAPPHQ
jgi:shikimate dehydrogenase